MTPHYRHHHYDNDNDHQHGGQDTMEGFQPYRLALVVGGGDG
jgi:hypothetical protein